jgi:glycosyltransferase involved in cell wall biosynthesis
MLSIIIPSINYELSKKLSQNIEDTIGTVYEIIIYNNRENNIGICEIYNKCALKAKYENLCFIHEDIIFHSKNWGKVIIDLLQINDIGLIGVSGVRYKTIAPITWSSSDTGFFRMNAIQRFKDGEIRHGQINPLNEKYSRVAVIDGFFMCTKKSIFDKIRFNDVFLKGFHLYDIDYSIRVGNHYQVVVTHDVLIEHFSEGNLDLTWEKENIRWHKRFENYLPVFIDNLSSRKKKESICKRSTNAYSIITEK